MTRAYDFLVFDTKEEYDDVIAFLTASLRTEPDHVIALHNRATAYDEIGQPRMALADLDRAVAVGPAPAGALGRRGLVKAGLGDDAGAVADYSRAIDLDPRRAKLFALRSAAFARLGDADRAAADDAQAKALVASDPMAQEMLRMRDEMRDRDGRADVERGD